MAWNFSTLPCASSPSAALAAGAMASKMPSSASLLPCVGSLAEAVAGDQLGVVEVVAGVHAHARGQAPAHGDFLVLVQQRDLDAVDLAGCAAMMPSAVSMARSTSLLPQ
jgi:acyl-CoA reductase-like NAD-dependent aldehyde dehydrogenase